MEEQAQRHRGAEVQPGGRACADWVDLDSSNSSKGLGPTPFIDMEILLEVEERGGGSEWYKATWKREFELP